MLTMDKLDSKEEEVRKKEITINEMVEENQEDRTEVPVIKMNPEDNLKDTTDLSQDNLKDSTNPTPSLTEENLDPNPTKDNLVLNQNKTAEIIKANQEKE